jgi:hypothetical protein
VWKLAIILLLSAPASAADISTMSSDAPQQPGPVLADPGQRWPGVMVIVSLGLFLMAAVVGPLVRAHESKLEESDVTREKFGATRHGH